MQRPAKVTSSLVFFVSRGSANPPSYSCLDGTPSVEHPVIMTLCGHSMPLIVGVVKVMSCREVRVQGPDHTIFFRGDETDKVTELLDLLDGRLSLDLVCERADLPRDIVLSILNSLDDKALIVDAGRIWSMFQTSSSNPQSAQTASYAEVSSSPRWRPPAGSVAHPLDRSKLALTTGRGTDPARIRQSFARVSPPPVDPLASEAVALRLAYGAYSRVDGCRRPVASAGGLEPIHLLTFGISESRAECRVLSVSDDGDTCYELGRLPVKVLLDTLVTDPVIEATLLGGGAVIAICADPHRIVRRYADRGWRYALLEAGAVSHEIALLAGGVGVQCRPVGGFLDARVAQFCGGLIPLLLNAIFVEAVAPSFGTGNETRSAP